jgi:hypothetical protein
MVLEVAKSALPHPIDRRAFITTEPEMIATKHDR